VIAVAIPMIVFLDHRFKGQDAPAREAPSSWPWERLLRSGVAYTREVDRSL